MIEWEKTSDRFVKHGRLIVSSGTNTSCYRSIYLPLVQLGSESFPKIVLISGVHGDEYEGPALLNRLIAKLACKQLNYCVTVVPCANPIAFASGSRLSPEDSANLASSFVRGATSGVTQVIAKLLEECVFHDAQVIIDLHAGGLSFTYTPCAVLLKTIGSIK